MLPAEKIQRLIIQLLAKNPVGVGLLLIGGFRYRLLNSSPRSSVDLDFHVEDDLTLKTEQLLAFIQRNVLARVRRQFGFDGSAKLAVGPGAESPNARFIDLAFWKDGTANSRVEIPLEITRVPRLDPPVVRTIDGVIYPTLSDADVLESKVLAIFNRTFLQHRDLVDLFLFQSQLHPEASRRLEEKLRSLPISRSRVIDRLNDFRLHPDYHAKAIENVIASQFDEVGRGQLRAAGGATFVFNEALYVLQRLLPAYEND